MFSFNVIRSASLPEQPANFTPGDELHLVFSEQPGEPLAGEKTEIQLREVPQLWAYPEGTKYTKEISGEGFAL